MLKQVESNIYWALRKKAIALCKNYNIIQICIDNDISNVITSIEEIKDHFDASDIRIGKESIYLIGTYGEVIGCYRPITNTLLITEEELDEENNT